MLRNRMGFDLDDFAVNQPFFGSFTDALLESLDQPLVLLHGSSTNRHVVVLGEHPGIKVWRYISTHIHLSQVFVVLHLLGRQSDALLESDGHVVVTGIHSLGHSTISAISPHNQINF